jgi:hypothetical protein
MNESQLKISKILNNIIGNEKEDMEEYYGVIIPVYRNIDKYLNELDDVKDKIFLAQWCKDYDKVKELKATLSLTEYEKKQISKIKRKKHRS